MDGPIRVHMGFSEIIILSMQTFEQKHTMIHHFQKQAIFAQKVKLNWKVCMWLHDTGTHVQ